MVNQLIIVILFAEIAVPSRPADDITDEPDNDAKSRFTHPYFKIDVHHTIFFEEFTVNRSF